MNRLSAVVSFLLLISLSLLMAPSAGAQAPNPAGAQDAEAIAEALAEAKLAKIATEAKIAEIEAATKIAEAQAAAEQAAAATEAAKSNPIALGNPEIYSKSLAALTMLLVVATLLESAFALLFNWRVFLAFVSLRGMRTIIMVVASAIVVWQFKLDIVSALVNAYSTPGSGSVATGGIFSGFITALILAGGSTGIHNILHALGYRNSQRERELQPVLDKAVAWIAVKVDRKKSVGEVDVQLKELERAPTDAELPIVGTVGADRPELKDLLFRNLNRFPANGGYTVTPNKVYELSVVGLSSGGEKISGVFSEAGGIEQTVKTFVCAPRAIVNFNVKV